MYSILFPYEEQLWNLQEENGFNSRIIAVLLSDIMCAVVAYNYSEMKWGIQYAGYSAPAWTAFLLAIPFVVAIGICVALAIVFKRKSR